MSALLETLGFFVVSGNEDLLHPQGHVLPWVGRRLRGVSNGDGLAPRHARLVDVITRGR